MSIFLNPLTATIQNLQMNCLSGSDHFVGLALKWLSGLMRIRNIICWCSAGFGSICSISKRKNQSSMSVFHFFKIVQMVSNCTNGIKSLKASQFLILVLPVWQKLDLQFFCAILQYHENYYKATDALITVFEVLKKPAWLFVKHWAIA